MTVRGVGRAVALSLVVCIGAVACGANNSGLTFGQGVPADVRALAEATWEQLTAVLPAADGCVGPIELSTAWEMDERARYDPGRGLVTVRIPGTAPNLQATMLHEFAHHLDFTCPRARQVRAAFLEAQGFPPTAAWSHGETWETTPSEQYAEAVARVVMGKAPSHRTVVLSDQALEVIRAWGRAA